MPRPEPYRRITLSRILGFTALVLSLVSLLYTFQYNWNQSHISLCNNVVTRDTIRAIQARDEAILVLAESNKRIVSGEIPDRPGAIQTYNAGLDNYRAVIQRAPLPDDSCLFRQR